ncbi:hypothetical protein F5882DRAFT_498209 [Hyaloscypha sp. PMI_1271]|nr:hypothetical protein F5882DRAFT_498209 [Hyaloscypha sp. PMI_1271]
MGSPVKAKLCNTCKAININDMLANSYDIRPASFIVEDGIGYNKLAAISGIASEFGKLIGGDVYVAGMWKKDLLYNLSWRMEKDGIYLEEYRSPSWSWACIDGPITFPPHLEGSSYRGPQCVK